MVVGVVEGGGEEGFEREDDKVEKLVSAAMGE